MYFNLEDDYLWSVKEYVSVALCIYTIKGKLTDEKG